MSDVTIEKWAVIRAQGAGSIDAISHNRDNAILAYTWNHVSKQPGFNFKQWWNENAKKKHLVCQKVLITTKHISGTPYSNWSNVVEKQNRCVWDTGEKTICTQQCSLTGKHLVDGHRLCGIHMKAYQRTGRMVLLPH